MSTYENTTDGGQPRSTTEIESGIRNTRERMDSTLDELSNRLKPRSLLNSAMDWWETNKPETTGSGNAGKVYRTLTTHVKNNPVPSLLIGAGVAWLLLNNKDEEENTSSYDEPYIFGKNRPAPPQSTVNLLDEGDFTDGESNSESGLLDKVKEKAHDAKDAVSGLLDTAKSKVGNLVSSAGDSTGKAREQARGLYDRGHHMAEETGRSLQHKYDSGIKQLQTAVEEYPLAMGAACVALGALTGVLLPRTRREDRLVGEKSDSLMEAAKEKGGELLDKGKAVAGQVAGTVMEEAKQKGISAETAGDKLSELAGKTGEVIRRAVAEAGAAVKPPEPNEGNEPQGNEPKGNVPQESGESYNPYRANTL